MEPFLSRQAPERGYTRGEIRGRLFESPTHGVVRLATPQPALFDECQAVALALPPDAVFTSFTAAQLRGWWLPWIPDLPLIASSNGDAPHHDRRGVYVRRCSVPTEHRRIENGVPIASAEWTINELAEDLALIDLVAVIDSALHFGHTTVDRLWAATVKGRRGVRTLRQALSLCDGRSESPWETVLRLLHELSGIPVEPQVEVRIPMLNVTYRLDLLVKGSRRAQEYDGGGHRDAGTHDRDLRRSRHLLREGYDRGGYTKRDIAEHPDQIVIEAAEAAGLDVSRLDTRIFRDYWLKSSHTSRGRARLFRRLRRFDRTEPPRRVAQK